MSYVFISYSKKNGDYAHRLTDYLLGHGFDVWIDDRIDYGDNWERVIFDSIENCAAFIVVMSPDSYASQWVQRECHFAEKREKPVFPVLIKGDEFPRYGLTQYVNATDGKMPPTDFLDRLALSIPRRETRGQTIITREIEPPEENRHIPADAATTKPITPFFTLSVSGQRPQHILNVKTPQNDFPAEIHLKDKRITVGRGDQNTLVIPSRMMSRNHFALIRTPLGYAVKDTFSANGTYLNDTRITDVVPLSDGDVIRAGEVTFQYRLKFHDTALTSAYAVMKERLSDPNCLPPERAEIGLELAAQGDWRYGVGLDVDGHPAVDWVIIPAGQFIYQTDTTLTLPDYAIARYPVTYSQFNAFVQDGGYTEPSWWTDADWNWKSGKPCPEQWDNPAANISNHPVVGVSYYEAQAFCRWLSAKLEHQIRLPTETEWEKAARGTNGCLYPWGHHYLFGYANLNEALSHQGPFHLEHATAAGLFWQGASPYGVLDMIGNVYEWCSSAGGEAEAVLRGGAWISPSDLTNVTTRRVFSPDEAEIFVGFRLACTLNLEV